ncbi:MAG TPA: sugar ABC transporter substrate-binding protein [Planctomycetota bacterium]|nr:sugar ABC transporter substrate-binding protein [Planctomycetota bacterium]HRR78561.1 sugar ABC transporter substrate-binding protein [Planctomycetota bacterium]HRT94810.1 sugar ABC transporter substrate-binding protein [Planctomycetota bacterium]
MGEWITPEVVLWAAAALLAGLAAIASRFEAHRLAGAAGWACLAVFVLGSCVWLFADTYSHYYGQKEAALRVSYWGSYREHEMWKEIAAAFRERYPEIPLKREYITDRYEEKIQQLLLSNDAPDVMLFQDEPLPRFITSDKFQPLNDFCRTQGLEIQLDRDYWDTAVQSFRRGAQVYGIPIWGGDCLLIYNRDAFRNAGVPEPPPQWTMDEFLATCKRLTADTDGDGRLDRFAFDIPGWVYWLPFQYAFGSDYLDPTRTRWTLWGPEAEAAYQLWQDLRYKFHVAPQRAELTEGGNVAFMTGRVAMFVSGPWAMPPLNEAGVSFDIADIPSGPGGHGTRVTWDALVMFAGSTKKDWAWKFIHFATSLPAQEIVARYQRSVPALKAAKDAFIHANPKVQAKRFIDALAYARFQPITEHWMLMSREIGSETDLMLDNRQTPAETLRRLSRNPHLAKCFKMPETP